MAAPNQSADRDRSREIKLIHVARRDLGMDEETYRAMLSNVAGVASSTALTAAGRKKVLAHLKGAGFVIKSPGAPAAPAADAQYEKIRALWTQLHRLEAVRVNTEAARRVYIKRVTGCSDYRFCSSAQTVTIIETLKKWLARVEAADAGQNKREVKHG